MKRLAAVISIPLLFVVAPILAQDSPSAEVVMQKVAKKLESTKHLGYKYHFVFREKGEPQPYEERADAILDLQPADAASPFRFQFAGPEKITIYNGIERFSLDKKEKKLSVKNKPSFTYFGDTLLHNSPLALKNALPKIAVDPAVPKKVTIDRRDGRDQYVVEFELPKGIISLDGGIVDAPPGPTNVYQMRVDKATMFPVEVIHTIDKDAATYATTFSNLTDKPRMPAPNSWFYSTYQPEYTLQKKKSLTLIEPTKAAPDFSLDAYGTAAKVALAQYKGKLLLLEFWIVNCGFCFQAVPQLNKIYDTYHDQGLEMLSVNMYDPPAAIESIKKKSKPEYPVATGGDSIAALYGVDAYPAIVLVGENGTVLYSSKGLEAKDLEAAITDHMKVRKP